MVTLGATGLVVSVAALGTFPFGGPVDEAMAARMLGRFRGAGGNFIDTADTYQSGRSETVVGRLIASSRDDLVLATKAYFGPGTGHVNDTGGSRRALMTSLEGSLRRLNVDCIDVYYLHRFDPTTPLEESIATLADMVRQGKIRYIGCSNFNGHQLERAVHLAEAAGCGPIVAVQNQYSLVERGIELEVWPVAAHHGLSVQAWSPLNKGFLAGRYTREGRGVGRFAERLAAVRPEQWSALDGLLAIAGDLGMEPAELAIAWVLARGALPLIGASRIEQLETALSALELRLDPEVIDRLTALCPPPRLYPYGFRTSDARGGFRLGSAPPIPEP